VDTVHECDGQTDRRTDGQTDRITITKTVQRIASHGKNVVKVVKSYRSLCCRKLRSLLVVCLITSSKVDRTIFSSRKLVNNHCEVRTQYTPLSTARCLYCSSSLFHLRPTIQLISIHGNDVMGCVFRQVIFGFSTYLVCIRDCKLFVPL